MEFRLLDPLEATQSKYLWSQAFESGQIKSEWQEIWDKTLSERSKMYGIYDDAGLQAAFNLTEHQQYFGERLVPVCVFSGVATLPAGRGKGYANLGVKLCYEKMREAGHYLTALTCFNWEFYQKLGFEWSGMQREYELPSKILKSSKETEFVFAATKEDRAGIEACYVEFAANYRGMLHRTEKHWDWVLDDAPKRYTYTYVYKFEGKIEGYFSYNDEGKEGAIRVRDFIMLTVRAQAGLLGLMRRMEMQVKKWKWTAPANDTLWSQIYHWDLETKLRPSQMVRIIDVKKALEAIELSPHKSKNYRSLVLEVADSDCPWNAGVWKVELENHTVKVEKTSDKPQVSMDIRALSQCYFGTPSVDEISEADRMEIHDMSCYFALSDLFDGLPGFTLIGPEY